MHSSKRTNSDAVKARTPLKEVPRFVTFFAVFFAAPPLALPSPYDRARSSSMMITRQDKGYSLQSGNLLLTLAERATTNLVSSQAFVLYVIFLPEFSWQK
jgi:hypothetical protein